MDLARGALARLLGSLLLAGLAGTAVAETKAKDPKEAGPHLRYARSYAEAVAEAKERGCVVFATFHEDG